MSDFEKAMNEYFERFDAPYPYALGFGYPGETPEDNIRIIQECIEKGEPVKFDPVYRNDCEY